MYTYLCHNDAQSFETWEVAYPVCPYCHNTPTRNLTMFTIYHAHSEYREHVHMRTRLRLWDIRIQRLYDGGYLPRVQYDAYHKLTSVWFFDWYHIQLPARAASLHPKQVNPPLTSIEPPCHIPRQYEPYTLVCLRFEPNTPGE